MKENAKVDDAIPVLMCLGHTVADVMVILGSLDIVMGEVDR